MTAPIQVATPSGPRSNSSHASACASLHRRKIALATHVQRLPCEWSRCYEYLQVRVAGGIVTLQHNRPRVLQHQSRLVKVHQIRIVARKREHSLGPDAHPTLAL